MQIFMDGKTLEAKVAAGNIISSFFDDYDKLENPKYFIE